MTTRTLKPSIYLKNTPTVERIVPELAVAIGLNESIMLLQIDHWIGISDNYEDGQWWTYQSVREMRKKAFPYWSIATINRTVKKLATLGYIVIGNYNKRRGDDTRWFALNVDKLTELSKAINCFILKQGVYQNETPQKSEGETVYQNETGVFQNDTTLPEITTKENKEQQQPVQPVSTIADVEKTHPKIFTFYEQTTGHTLTHYMGEAILEACEKYGENVVQDAMTEAARNNGRTWSYIEKILERWEREGRYPDKGKIVPIKKAMKPADDEEPVDWSATQFVRETGADDVPA